MQSQLVGHIIAQESTDFKDGTKMEKLTLLDEESKETVVAWVKPDAPKGFSVGLISKITGPKIRATFYKYEGKDKLDKIEKI